MSRIIDPVEHANFDQADSRPALRNFEAATGSSISFEPGVDDLENVSSLSVASIPENRLIALSEQRTLGAERIRILGARLRHMQQQRNLKTLLITSSIEGEGKSFLSINLAASLAKTRQRVLLIDGDCHRINLARLLGAKGLPGLSGWWHKNGHIANYLKRIEGFPLWFLPAGEPLEQPLEMLQSQRLSDDLTDISTRLDWVIIDSPPFAALADSAVWSNLADGILLVVRQGRTPSKVLGQVLDSIDRHKLLGMVLNGYTDPNYTYYASYHMTPPAPGRGSR